MPTINKEGPQVTGASVVTKKGVARYLNRLKRAELNNTLQSQKNAAQTHVKDTMNGSYSQAHQQKSSIQNTIKKANRKLDVTTPISPFTRDNEQIKQIETIVPQPKLQPCDKDILRRKQQEEHENFLKTVNHDPNHIVVNESRYAEAINQLHNQILSLELDVDGYGAR